MRQRITLVIAIMIVLASGLMMIRRTHQIEKGLQDNERASLRLPKDVEVSATPTNALDRPMLAFELPQRESDVQTLAPPLTRPLWRNALTWDFAFIAGYTLLLLGLPFGSEKNRTIFESVRWLTLITGFCDVLENTSQLIVLHDLDRGARLTGTNAYTSLPFLGVAKWFFFFLTCRALAIHYGQFAKWRPASILLRAFIAAGTWAALFTLAKLPGRAALGLVVIVISLVLLGLGIARIIWQEPGPAVDQVAEEGGAVGVPRRSGEEPASEPAV